MPTCPVCGKHSSDMTRHLLHTHKLQILRAVEVNDIFPTELVLEVANCKVEVNCPKRWEAMEESPFENVRFCGSCKQNVFLAKNEEQLKWAASRNHCAAVLTSEESMVVGMFAPPLNHKSEEG